MKEAPRAGRDRWRAYLAPAARRIEESGRRLRRNLYRMRHGKRAAASGISLMICGARRSGTSSLLHHLSEHPEIRMLYGRDFRGPDGLDSGSPLDTPFAALRADPEFQSRMRETVAPFAGHYAHIGWRMDYAMYFPHVLFNLVEQLPDLRLLFALRNPTDATYSVWCRGRERGLEADFETFLGMREEIRPPSDDRAHWARFYDRVDQIPEPVVRSIYDPFIARCLRLFPRERVHVYPFERFVSDPASTLSEVLAFLGLDPHHRFRTLGEIRSASRKPGEMAPATRARLLDFFSSWNRELVQRLGWPRETWET
ncbi:MAG: hypothetical protein HKP30_01880 [Myxococcales bacterium]|nr:hypothetical protein [Myxococcales bacterium]